MKKIKKSAGERAAERTLDLIWRKTYVARWERWGLTEEEIERRLEEKFASPEE